MLLDGERYLILRIMIYFIKYQSKEYKEISDFLENKHLTDLYYKYNLKQCIFKTIYIIKIKNLIKFQKQC